MSTRHRQEAPVTGKAKLAKDDRRGDRRRERHASKTQMQADSESMGAAATVRHREAPRIDRVPSSPTSERFRHWKEPFWKRRKLERKRRAELMLRAQRDGLPLHLEDEEDTTATTGPLPVFKVVDIHPKREGAPRRGVPDGEPLETAQA